MSCG